MFDCTVCLELGLVERGILLLCKEGQKYASKTRRAVEATTIWPLNVEWLRHRHAFFVFFSPIVSVRLLY